MKVMVVIPWRAEPSRVGAFKKLCNFFTEHHPDFDLVFSDSEDEIFNRSRSRNLGAKKAIDLDADIIIFNDADFFAQPSSVRKAVKLAYELQEVVLPYNVYCEHNEKKQTNIFLNKINFKNAIGYQSDEMPKILENGLPNKLYPCSGAVIFPTSIFQELGGYEEKISKWGPEDQVLHRMYFDKYNKLFTYVPGIGHSTYNDPSVRKNLEDHQKFFDFVYFKDKK
jgi:predicted glycosyltransferase involved in capsule biosynthesis